MAQKIWKFFASLRLTILLFALLTFSVLAGSFIIQKQFAADGQIEKVYSPEAIQVMDFFGMFDWYHSSWFSFLLFMFGVNNICASIEMWPRHKKLYKHRDPLLSLTALANQEQHMVVEVASAKAAAIFEDLKTKLTAIFAKPEVFEEGNVKRLYVNKTPWSHFGVYVVHVGVILILLGGVWGSIDGFEGQMMLTEGQTSNQVKVRNRFEGKGFKFLDFQVKCHDIWIETYENGAPKDYYSDLEILDNAGVSQKRGVIQVNEPLTYAGISFYQATYGSQPKNQKSTYALTYTDAKTKKVSPLILPTDGDSLSVPGTDSLLKFVTYKESLSIPFEGGEQQTGEFIGLELYEGQNKVPEKILLFKEIPNADWVYRPKANGHFAFQGLKEDFETQEVTGLQVARDPGANVVFAGSAILLLGVMLTFFTSHQKIWVVLSDGRLTVAGKAHRNPWAFAQKFTKLTQDLHTL